MPTDPRRPIPDPEPVEAGALNTDALLDELDQEEADREAIAGPAEL